MNAAIAIQHILRSAADAEQQKILSRFFKTGPGEYGEGDKFLGIRVPDVRKAVRQFKHTAGIDDVRHLVDSDYHEERLAGFLLLVEIYHNAGKKGNPDKIRFVVDFYLANIDRSNNWDLVDLVAPKILGDYIAANPAESYLLNELSAMEGCLWHQRVAIVSTWTLIRDGKYSEALSLAEKYLSHSHDLIQKASGWMLREIGKRGGMDELLSFLGRFAGIMPRTMLRYAIEKLPEEQRKYFMGIKQAKAYSRN